MVSHAKAFLISAAVAAVVVIAFGRVAFLKSLATPSA
jgi:hypothetical protein